MTIITSDPLAFLIGQGGMVGTPLLEAAANGARKLDVQQRGAVIGEPISIVFCRRVSGVGGVLISPPATEARFENSLTNEVTGFYHLVLGEGQMASIQVRDVFQRSCRVGSFSQTYSKRAGTFIPGNFIVARSGYTTPECPTYCGTGGRYTGLSTMTFQCTYPDGVDQWNRQVHCFIRGGVYVTRLLDTTLGPSNNVADLLLYLLRNSSRVPEAQIDTASLLAGATFTNANGFWFNGEVSKSTNVRDWIDSTLQYFLLRQARVAGKEAVSPLLPANNNGTIKTTAVGWEFTFTEEHIVPDSFDITYTPLADRKPFCALMLWRQQDDNGIGIIRTAEVRYAGTAADGPFEQHDLSAFCASENHAVKVGAYILSRRKHVTHRLQLAVKPDAFNGTLAAGDLVRVRLDRIASTGANSRHDYLYEVDRIGKSLTGEVQLELTHFPIDGNLASVVAQEVDAATGAGLILPTGLSGITCDVNSSGDTSVPADTSLDPGDWNLPDIGDFDYDIDEVNPIDTSGDGADLPKAWTSISGVASGVGGGGGGSGGGSPGGPGDYGNPEDDKDQQEDPPPIDPYSDWPPGYPTPNDPDWPFETTQTENPGPGGGNWITPVSPPDGWPFNFQANVEWHVTYNAVTWIGYASDCISVVNGGTLPASTGPSILEFGPPRGFFEEKSGASCGGHGSISYWMVVYPGDGSGSGNLRLLGGGGGGGNRINQNEREYSVSIVPV